MTTQTCQATTGEIESEENDSRETLLVADLFCGAGGSSSGARRAIENLGKKMELVAVNHWPVAVATHQANHPEARHYLQNLETADPETIVPGGYLDLLMASPECRYYSNARGGKPIQDQGRMSPWIIQRWITSINVQVILVENVPEFVHWGPLDENGRPDPERRGLYFEEWVRSLWGLGYHAEWRFLNSADFGEATSRTRFFMQARQDGKPIRWPEASHARDPEGAFGAPLKKWRGAREIIDWSNQGKSLLDDPKYVKKPLAEKTRRRIARGLEKYGGPLAWLYIRLLDLPEYAGLEYPPPHDISFTLDRNGNNGYERSHPVSEPDPNVNGRDCGYLSRTAEDPLVVQFQRDSNCSRIAEPLSTITAQGRKHGLVEPILVEYYSQSDCASVENPLPTVTTKDRHSLCQPTLVQVNHGGDGEGRTQSTAEPLPTQTARGSVALARPTMLQIDHGGRCDGNDRGALSVEEPAPTIVTKNNLALAQPEAVPLQDEENAVDPRRLVIINGKPHLLDIRFRMLQNLELARAMGFSDEETQYEFTGNVSEVTRQIGNAVPVKVAEALVGAVLAAGITPA